MALFVIVTKSGQKGCLARSSDAQYRRPQGSAWTLPMTPTPNSKKNASGLRSVGLGIELAASLVGFTLVGLWIDNRFSTGPWGTLICAALGLVGGFYNFLRSSLRVMRTPSFHEDGAEKDD